METYTLEKDITVFYVTAESFPAGIQKALDTLHSLLPTVTGRNFFGLSRPEHGSIVYKAAVEEAYSGEAEKLNCKSMTIQKGTYISIFITDYAARIESISEAFQTLLADPRIEHDGGYCVEQYTGALDVKCLVKLK